MATEQRDEEFIRCPQCDKPTAHGIDTCHSCGAPVESGDEISIELYEWAGGLIAGLGIFMTPALTAIPALYCAFRVYDYKPMSAYAILALVMTTIVAWALIPFTVL